MRLWVRTVYWLSALLLGSPSAALAQAEPATQQSSSPTDQQGPDEEAQEIIVTGSRIPRRELTSTSPITAVPDEEVRLQGASRTEELINSLPQVFPDQGSHISNEATGTATVNLRGLGASRTLVLINGRRLLPGSPNVPAPDLNAVPSALIERVEVLTGGASSVYGSDAVAGVVNFILDTDFEGVRLNGQTSFYQHDNDDGSGLAQALQRSGIRVPRGNVVDGGGLDVNGAAGFSFGGGRGHMMGYAGYRRLEAVTQDSRDYSACASQARLESEILDCGGSFTSATGNFATVFESFQLGPNRTFIPGSSLFNFGPYNYFQRPDERYIAGGFARYEISRAVEPYFEVMLMDDRTVAQIAPSGSFGNARTINCDNPLLSAQQLAMVCITGNFVGERINNAGQVEGSPTPFIDPVTGATYYRANLVVRRRSVEGGPRQDDLRHKSLRALGGVRGELGRGWSHNTYYLLGRVKFSDTYLNDLSITRIRRALDVVAGPDGQPVCRSFLTGDDPECVPWDIFALNAVTPEAAAYLPLSGTRRGTVRQRVAVASVTGDLGELGIRSPRAAEGVAVNFGVEHRKDSVEFRPDEIFATGDLAGQGRPSPPFEGSVTVREAFVETRIPLLSRNLVTDLSLEGGYRISRYDNGISHFTTDTYKLGVIFAPIADVRFRGSYNRAIRAPNIQELFSPQFLGSGFQIDPCAGPQPAASQAQCALTGVSAAQYGSILASPFAEYNSLSGGNPNLGTETATTRTIGVVLRPRFLPGFAATADWFDIDLKGAIGTVFPQLIVNYCVATGDPTFCSRIHRDQFGSLWLTPEGFVDSTRMNVGAFRTSGVDLSLNYDRGLGRLGSLKLNLLGTWLKELVVDDGGLAIPYDCAGLYGFVCGTPNPEWRHKARVTWTTPAGVTLSLQWRHFGSVAVDSSSDHPTLAFPFSPRDARIPAQNFFDLTAVFRFRRSYDFRLGVKNLFDREPPIVGATGFIGNCPFPSCNGNTFPQLYDPLGRYFFAGVTVDF